MSSNIAVSDTGAAGKKKESTSERLYKIWKYTSVEPLLFCLVVPSFFLYIAIENLSLEKVIRRNRQCFFKIH